MVFRAESNPQSNPLVVSISRMCTWFKASGRAATRALQGKNSGAISIIDTKNMCTHCRKQPGMLKDDQPLKLTGLRISATVKFHWPEWDWLTDGVRYSGHRIISILLLGSWHVEVSAGPMSLDDRSNDWEARRDLGLNDMEEMEHMQCGQNV